ncbi:restriction endonuclease subunit S [Streptococcus uberis]|uniref:restriction endonuclease subunit S n=1 Tax=Streptococcus uberis TaxID=1349 RepID=UPI001939F1A2|nr:restriction endonuclease subunit S [Streptococcus uberis]
MNKIETLIQELCPNGVEKKELSQISRLTRGKVMSKQFLEENSGDFPVYSSQTRNRGEIGKISTYDFDGEYITWTTDGANAGTVFYRNGKFSITNVCGLIDITDNNLSIKYLYYILSISTKKYVSSGMGNPKLMSNVVGKIKIPVPPFEVQEEIVKILDKLTDYVTELTTELTLRQKQYNYYRDKLLSFEGEKVQHVKLSTVCQVYDGTHQTPRYRSEGVPFVSVENIKNLYKTSKYISIEDFEKYKIKPRINDILMTRIGDVGTCNVVDRDEDLAYYVSLALIRPNIECINPYFLRYFIESRHGRRELNRRILHTAVPIKINMGDIGKIMISLPSMEIQTQIVKILDNFNHLTSNISNGLPKEIELRQKQYEYYRDKLLTFD